MCPLALNRWCSTQLLQCWSYTLCCIFHFTLCICVWVYVCFVCIYVYIPWVAGIHRGNQILWDWIYSQLWATMWMLGIESGASERLLFLQHSHPCPNLDKAVTLEWVKLVVLPWEENINFADQFFSSIKMVCKSFCHVYVSILPACIYVPMCVWCPWNLE